MTFKFIKLFNTPIWEQLRMEEALFRAGEDNYCLINAGSPPAVILGLSSKVEQVVHQDLLGEIPLWRRFTGGGTVVVDESTLFVTFVGNASDFQVLPYPHDLFLWSKSFYKEVFSPFPFALKEHDYVIEGKKMGGNAQGFARDRFIHHTSFLWDYKKKLMALLKMPPRMPIYRQNREHGSFLTTLKEFLPSKDFLFVSVEREWERRYGKNICLNGEIGELLEKEHRKSLSEIKKPA